MSSSNFSRYFHNQEYDKTALILQGQLWKYGFIAKQIIDKKIILLSPPHSPFLSFPPPSPLNEFTLNFCIEDIGACPIYQLFPK